MSTLQQTPGQTTLHFAFLQPFMQRGGTEVVFDATTRRLTSFNKFGGVNVKITYLSPSIDTTQWHKPIEDCIVTLLPQQEMWHEDNLKFLERYIKQEQIDLIFYSANALHITESIAERLGTRLVPWLHNMIYSELIHKKFEIKTQPMSSPRWWLHAALYYSGLYKLRRRQVYARDLKLCYRYIVLHSSYREQLAKALRLTPQQREKIIPLINTIPIAEHREPLEKKKEIVFVGRLCPIQKQVTRLVDIWSRIEAQLPDWEVKIYGTGEDEGRIRQLIEQRNLKHIHLCGYLAEPSKVYKSAAILCLTSVYEGWGLVLAEAQNYGAVPISFNCATGTQAVIGINNPAGVLIPCFDHAAYAEELLHLCQDDAHRTQLQARCLEKRMDYAPDVNDEVWGQLLQDIVKEKSGSA